MAPLPDGMTFAELERRFFQTLDCQSKQSHPMQLSLRAACFDSFDSRYKSWFYTHELFIDTGAVATLKQCVQKYSIPFDVVFLSIVLSAMFRATYAEPAKPSWRKENNNRGTNSDAPASATVHPRERLLSFPLTIYAPMRDGDLNDAMIGLFSDWRDTTVTCSPSATVLGLCVDIAENIRHRRWTVFDAMQNSQRILVNILPLDEQARGPQEFRQTRAHEYRDRRFKSAGQERKSFKGNGRPMRLTLEQEAEDAWWISMDMDAGIYSCAWCRRFVLELKRSIADLAERPSQAIADCTVTS